MNYKTAQIELAHKGTLQIVNIDGKINIAYKLNGSKIYTTVLNVYANEAILLADALHATIRESARLSQG